MPATGVEFEEDVITVCHLGESLLTPSPSPFVLKLLTYLRMAGIKYKCENTLRASSKGKMPFILYKGKEVADSTFITQFLNREMNINLNSGLNAAEKATALAFQRLCEENLYWIIVHNRWIVDNESFWNLYPMGNFKKKVFLFFSSIKIKPTQKANLMGHGIGRHSIEEILSIGERDLKALSDFLGDKPFFMGEEPTEVDAVVFGTVLQFAHAMHNSEPEKIVHEKFPNLVAYSDRMKEKYWPDWEEQCCQEEKAVETKEKNKGDAADTKEDSTDPGAETGTSEDVLSEDTGVGVKQPRKKLSEQRDTEDP